jgi:uncharacterized membrane protein YtjA (UPF0391 family)
MYLTDGNRRLYARRLASERSATQRLSCTSNAACGTGREHQCTTLFIGGSLFAWLGHYPGTLRTRTGNHDGGHIMLYYALVFFIVAIIAAAFGFGGIAAGAASIAKILFFIFLIVFLVTLVMGLIRR